MSAASTRDMPCATTKMLLSFAVHARRESRSTPMRDAIFCVQRPSTAADAAAAILFSTASIIDLTTRPPFCLRVSFDCHICRPIRRQRRWLLLLPPLMPAMPMPDHYCHASALIRRHGCCRLAAIFIIRRAMPCTERGCEKRCAKEMAEKSAHMQKARCRGGRGARGAPSRDDSVRLSVHVVHCYRARDEEPVARFSAVRRCRSDSARYARRQR